MLYEELSNLCPDCTYEQYESIERIYNACPSMDKERAARVWTMTYGVEVEQEKKEAKLKINNCEKGTMDMREIKHIVTCIEEAAKNDIFCNSIQSRGINFRRSLVNNSNDGSIMQYAVEVFNNGSWVRTAYRYSMPDFYVWVV